MSFRKSPMNPRVATLGLFVFAVTLLSAIAGRASAFEGEPNLPLDAPQPVRDDYQPLAEFSRSFFSDALERHLVPGAVVAIAHEDEVVLLRGYGHADLERGLSAHPTETRFRVGSVSKIFTTVAVMQLLDDGLATLDGDVGDYLEGWRPPWRYDEPVTLHHLMTHTSGLDARFLGIAAREDDQPGHPNGLESHLSHYWPNQSHRPGQFSAYSNYGYALLGHVVASVRDEAFVDLMQSRVIERSSMSDSRFGFDLADREALATGYRLVGKELHPLDFERYHIQPASSLVTTASDMAQFMMKLWGEGSPLLSDGSLARMLGPQFRHHPALSGRAYGFHERFMGGERILAHAGGLRGFSSYLAIWPERKLGVFLAVNRFDDSLREAWVQGLASRFPSVATARASSSVLPLANVDEARVSRRRQNDPRAQHIHTLNRRPTRKRGTIDRRPVPPELAGQLEGSYQALRFKSSLGFEKLMTLFSANRLVATEDGGVAFHSYESPSPSKFWFQGNGMLASPNDDRKMAYRMDAEGQLTHVFIGSEAYEKLSWLDQPEANRKAFGWFLIGFVVSGSIWLLSGLVRMVSRYRGLDQERSTVRLLLWGNLGLIGLTHASFLIGLGAVASRIDPADYLFGMPGAMKLVLCLPLLGIGLTGLSFWLLRRESVRKTLSRLEWVATPMVLTLSVLFIAFLHHWHLLGFRF